QGMLIDTDARVQAGKGVAPSYLLACVLWQDVLDGWAARRNGTSLGNQKFAKTPTFPALADSVDAAFEERIGDVSGRGKLGADMREIWMMQPRFEKRVGSTPFGMVDQPRFRASFDFMRLRAVAGEVEESLAEWWQEFSIATDEQREDMVAEVREEQRAKPKAAAKPRTVVPKNAPKSAESPLDNLLERTEEGDDEAEPANTDPAKKRRRRKRGGAKKPNPAFVPNPPDGTST
ncbi:MAG: hypothetical protein RL761_479, partial [Pseudomonadota bacterium]